MNRFLTSNEWQWRLLRTVVQGVLGVSWWRTSTCSWAWRCSTPRGVRCAWLW